MNKKLVADNKRFNRFKTKTVKPFLSNKVQSPEKINLTKENDSLITNCG